MYLQSLWLGVLRKRHHWHSVENKLGKHVDCDRSISNKSDKPVGNGKIWQNVLQSAPPNDIIFFNKAGVLLAIVREL